jgi:hypothetical protein
VFELQEMHNRVGEKLKDKPDVKKKWDEKLKNFIDICKKMDDSDQDKKLKDKKIDVGDDMALLADDVKDDGIEPDQVAKTALDNFEELAEIQYEHAFKPDYNKSFGLD